MIDSVAHELVTITKFYLPSDLDVNSVKISRATRNSRQTIQHHKRRFWHTSLVTSGLSRGNQ